MKKLAIILVLCISFKSAILCAKTFEADLKFRPVVTTPKFIKNHPVVFFDQSHLNLASADGRYAPLIHLLESDGFKVMSVKSKITSSLLKTGKILYISGAQGIDDEKATPPIPSAFSKKEESCIEEWVRGGGSLLLMADHAPIGDAIHPLAAKFGFNISGGETNDPKNYLAALNDKSHLFFSVENGLLGSHAIVRGLSQDEQVKRVAFFSGQSVLAPKESRTLLKLASSAVSHYPDGHHKPIKGGFVSAASLLYGKGKVIVFGDATVFTSKFHTIKKEKEGMNRTDIDNTKLATNTFRWLADALNPTHKTKIAPAQKP